MAAKYLLIRRESIPLNISEPGRPARFESYELFEFVPNPGPDQSVKGS
jgi:hypothetical protein